MIPADWPLGEYAAIVADPPWHYATWSEAGRDRCPDYPTMPLDEIAALPVPMIAAEDCVLFLWAVDPMLPQALDLIRAWGFTYKTVAFTWVKLNPSGVGVHMGPGHWTRANPEPCLLATRGRPHRQSRGVRQLIIAPRREHSRKPDSLLSRVESLVSGPYCELFARTRRPGWTSWGNDLDRFPALAG
ncbi:MAG: MT-A70 family methyltransferase [Rhodospirillaceae bacterium]